MYSTLLVSIMSSQVIRARICKRLWSPGIDSEESSLPAYTVKGADIKCYQITMSTCTVAI